MVNSCMTCSGYLSAVEDRDRKWHIRETMHCTARVHNVMMFLMRSDLIEEAEDNPSLLRALHDLDIRNQ